MNNFALFISTIFGGAWELFALKVPGFPFSFGDIIVATSLASICLWLIKLAFGASGGSGADSKGKSTRNPKISEERKNDTK